MWTNTRRYLKNYFVGSGIVNDTIKSNILLSVDEIRARNKSEKIDRNIKIFKLYYFEGLTAREIGEKFGISKGNAYRIAHKVIRIVIRRCFDLESFCVNEYKKLFCSDCSVECENEYMGRMDFVYILACMLEIIRADVKGKQSVSPMTVDVNNKGECPYLQILAKKKELENESAECRAERKAFEKFYPHPHIIRIERAASALNISVDKIHEYLLEGDRGYYKNNSGYVFVDIKWLFLHIKNTRC